MGKAVPRAKQYRLHNCTGKNIPFLQKSNVKHSKIYLKQRVLPWQQMYARLFSNTSPSLVFFQDYERNLQLIQYWDKVGVQYMTKQISIFLNFNLLQIYIRLLVINSMSYEIWKFNAVSTTARGKISRSNRINVKHSKIYLKQCVLP